MQTVIEKKAETRIAGFSIRTANAEGRSIREQGAFWQRFFTEGMAEKIPGIIDPSKIYGIYYNYESDFEGEYSFLIGFEIAPEAILPEGVESIVLPAGTYSVFTEDKPGPIGEKIGKIWAAVWQSGIRRSYETDFEVYNTASMQSENPEVSVYIGIK